MAAMMAKKSANEAMARMIETFQMPKKTPASAPTARPAEAALSSPGVRLLKRAWLVSPAFSSSGMQDEHTTRGEWL